MIYIDHSGHLISNTSIEELHSFAKLLGLKREWFQSNTGHFYHPHYDLTTKRIREAAIKHGAVLVSSKELVRILRSVRNNEH